VVSAADPLRSLISVLYTGAATFNSSSNNTQKGRVDPVPDPLLQKKSGNAGESNPGPLG
jgi:hypothetical protein